MSSFKIELNGMTIGMLKKIISDIPDECMIDVFDVGKSGFVDGCELEVTKYENLIPDVSLNIKAESGYY